MDTDIHPFSTLVQLSFSGCRSVTPSISSQLIMEIEEWKSTCAAEETCTHFCWEMSFGDFQNLLFCVVFSYVHVQCSLVCCSGYTLRKKTQLFCCSYFKTTTTTTKKFQQSSADSGANTNKFSKLALKQWLIHKLKIWQSSCILVSSLGNITGNKIWDKVQLYN